MITWYVVTISTFQSDRGQVGPQELYHCSSLETVSWFVCTCNAIYTTGTTLNVCIHNCYVRVDKIQQYVDCLYRGRFVLQEGNNLSCTESLPLTTRACLEGLHQRLHCGIGRIFNLIRKGRNSLFLEFFS
jgi:hypothetical protein